MGCLYLNDKVERERRMSSVMELFPILHQKRRDLASQMSGGQQQMLALGRGLMADPEILLLDEPTLGLAPKVVKEVFQKVSEINERLSTTIFVVEHNIKGVLDIADRAYVLSKGCVVHDGTPQSGPRDQHPHPGLPRQSRQGIGVEGAAGTASPMGTLVSMGTLVCNSLNLGLIYRSHIAPSVRPDIL